ncbi:hypothetical protein M8C21_003467 [Ambrosia artemisiifolia]|uniref:MLO-like protein n=1 Tax=Ambrosia artemisiifolia TaxID=4212 RepID=A0AAD5C727_AMBAR|nr:hypothetical protein M8C21_003467 [Ambrosia artemisiifolia]
MPGGDGERMLDQTATWSVACVCAVIVILSMMLEHSLHSVGRFLKKRHKPGLLEALENIKSELMVLGFISLLLVFSQNYIASICVSKELTKNFLPCKKDKYENQNGQKKVAERRLLWNEHRRLAGDEPPKECKPGYEQIISVAGLHQLHIFIFFLAVFHVMYSAMTMISGRAKTRKWKLWEREILEDHVPGNDPSKFRLTKDLSFVKHHTGAFTNTPAMFYIVCFFKQFVSSVRKSDYLAIRHAFFSVHLAPGTHFNFQKYIKRSLEDDFKVIVGISPMLWATAVLFLFANVDGARIMTYLSLFPVIIILAVGTKLQAIVSQMAVEIQERQILVQGLCSYSILPLYALVTQMGSTMKKSIFDDHTSKTLKKWHAQVKKKEKAASRHEKKTKTTTSEPPAKVDIPEDHKT